MFHADHADKPIVAVQGLGFVGAAMAAALATTNNTAGKPLYRILGLDLGNEEGLRKIQSANAGTPPIRSNDKDMDTAYAQAHKQGNLFATNDITVVSAADIVVVDIPFDVKKTGETYTPRLELFLDSIRNLARHVREDALVLVETTVPPGTTENYLHPIFMEELQKRGKDTSKFSLAHSYERVTPGANYLKSITQFYRVYAGMDQRASDRTRAFLESFINTKDFPLSELHRPSASEMAKVMENSFRALNIAFLQEWTEFAEGMNVDMFDVLKAIRMRPTHKNIMSPGFGVGGYCLTKDALLADWACEQATGKDLPLSKESIRINDTMPGHSAARLKDYFGNLKGRTIALMGVSYLNDVADTRYSPSDYFVTACEKDGAKIIVHDPLVPYWPEKSLTIETDISAVKDKDESEALVLAVRHSEYIARTAKEWLTLFPKIKVVLDANNILNDTTANDLRSSGIDVLGIGKGHWTTQPEKQKKTA